MHLRKSQFKNEEHFFQFTNELFFEKYSYSLKAYIFRSFLIQLLANDLCTESKICKPNLMV